MISFESLLSEVERVFIEIGLLANLVETNLVVSRSRFDKNFTASLQKLSNRLRSSSSDHSVIKKKLRKVIKNTKRHV